MTIREARPDDLPEIRAMLLDHARSEGGRVPVAGDALDTALFGERAAVAVAVAVAGDGLAGLAMWYPTFSSWALRAGIWLEDLYVREEFRRAGVGEALMRHLRQRTDGRIEWDVSAGNDRAHRFYQRLGARPLDGPTRYRWPATEPETRPA